ncbi:MAG: hypothetical protein GY777_01595 [Candidatus Brocadiaceae bacterium]|nr:hypothetical protein [Candidatus Brocadiaceae bacterium]
MIKDIKDISIFLNVRTSSTRCHNKMLRPFAGSTLIDTCLKKLYRLAHIDIYYGAHEEELLDKAGHYSFLKPYKRSYESAYSHNDASIIFEILNHITTKWVLWINPCVPFLKMDTVLLAIDTFLSLETNSLTSVKKMQGWFYNTDGEPLTNIKNNIATQDSDYLLEVAHAFHIYEREFMIRQNEPWTNKKGDPYLFIMPFEESYDIDTEEQFHIYESMYKFKNGL